jgi:hypothetical protein
VKKLFNLPGPFLTARDAWAGTFDGVVSLTAPRTDCPCKLLFLITQAFFLIMQASFSPGYVPKLPILPMQFHQETPDLVLLL